MKKTFAILLLLGYNIAFSQGIPMKKFIEMLDMDYKELSYFCQKKGLTENNSDDFNTIFSNSSNDQQIKVSQRGYKYSSLNLTNKEFSINYYNSYGVISPSEFDNAVRSLNYGSNDNDIFWVANGYEKYFKYNGRWYMRTFYGNPIQAVTIFSTPFNIDAIKNRKN